MNLKNNPLLGNEKLPLYDQIKAEHVVPAIEHILQETESEFRHLESTHTPSWEGLMEPLAKLSLKIHHTWSPITHLNGVLNSPPLREAYEKVQSDVITLCLKMNQSQKLYQGLKTIAESPNWASFSEARQRIIESSIKEAELSGIGLEGSKKAEFNELAKELTSLSTKFANNVLDATKQFHLILESSAETSGLPSSFLKMAAQSYNQKFPDEKKPANAENGPWLVTLDYPSFVPFMENSKRRDLREKIYRKFVSRASEEPFDNRDIVRRILQIRKKQAELLGFSSYAELSLSRKMAESVEAVLKLEEELLDASWQHAQKELEDLQSFAKKEQFAGDIKNWDLAFWAKRLQEDRFQFNDEELRPYFAFPKVLDGLFQLVNKLFGITVKSADADAPKWHEDVRFFKIYNEENQHIASFYLDPYSRPENKRGGAWMDECLPRYKMDQELVLPVAYLVCNSTPPVKNDPSLMTFREVETLFHEFGHGLQHMLTKVDEVQASGINGVEWDAVELPSQFMENWCYHKPTLFSMARHYQTGNPIPEDLYHKLVTAKTYRAGQIMLRQIQFGLLDLKLHHSYDAFGETSPFDVQREVAKKTSVIPQLKEDFFLCAFTHIFSGGYAAGYYSYKWAEVLSADAFSAFEEIDIEKDEEVKKVGTRFKDTILALGGSQHPLKVFREFRGREPSTQALLKHNDLLPE